MLYSPRTTTINIIAEETLSPPQNCHPTTTNTCTSISLSLKLRSWPLISNHRILSITHRCRAACVRRVTAKSSSARVARISIYLICNIIQATRPAPIIPTTFDCDDSCAKNPQPKITASLNGIIVVCIPYSCRLFGGIEKDGPPKRNETFPRRHDDNSNNNGGR